MAFALVVCSMAVVPSPCLAGEWHVTFADEFNGDSVDTTAWTVSDHDPIISQYDGHDALFVKERVSVSNGHLTITTVLDPQTFQGVHYNMTSGYVLSKQKRNQSVTDGPTRFEASVRMPDSKAHGAWPAWWLLPEGLCWPVGGEIDIVEWYGDMGHYQHSHVGLPVSASQTYHYGFGCSDDASSYDDDCTWYPSLQYNSTDPVIDYSADFHVFGIEINDTALRFYVDNTTTSVREIGQLCVTDPGFQWGHTRYLPWAPLYGILNVAVKDHTNTTWWETHNATTLFDWVRFYQYRYR